jgi:excinuclease ABC subunit C
LADYRANLRKLVQYLRGERVALVKEIEQQMNKASKSKDFEAAAKFRNQLFALKELSRQSLFGDREALDASRDQALVDLALLLNLKKPPIRIEGFDISHMQGTDTAASMVVFVNGVPDKASYRKFRMRIPGNDDFAHMHEALTRRLREDNRKKWGMPDLILIDGGKGQLQAAARARTEADIEQIPMIGLAKREEEIIIRQDELNMQLNRDYLSKLNGYAKDQDKFVTLSLPQNTHIVKLLQRIRDESHRFAVSYHSTLKRKRQTASLLDDIPGIGPATRKKLIKRFGSARGVLSADTPDLQAVLGNKKGQAISKFLAAYK